VAKWIPGVVVVMVVVAAACGACTNSAPASAVPTTTGEGGKAMAFTIGSVAFHRDGAIPAKYSCDGDNVSVPVEWADPPENAKSFALIVDDPDAPSGTFVHWVIYNIPASARALTEAVPTDATLQDGSRNGTNGARKPGYTGPCPPSGTHHYHFKLYALDTVLSLNLGATKDQLLDAMKGHILEQAELVGTYSRK
jgi:Raf kinase inhibitor-like YbhB/YbcL family protein